MTDNSEFVQPEKMLTLKRVTEDLKKDGCEHLMLNQQCKLRLLKGTTIFSLVFQPNLNVGGYGGATLDLNHPLIMMPATDIVKIGTKDKCTKFAVQEKIFKEFTGYLLNPEGNKIAYLSANMYLLPPTYGVNYSSSVEDQVQGIHQEVKRWAHFDDIITDFNYAKEMWKYLMIHSVDGGLWESYYNKAWDGKAYKPHMDIHWSTHEYV